MLLQTEQRRSLAFSSRTASESASASAALERRMWKARRWALLAPMPGSLRSSSMRRAMGSANRDMRVVLETRQIEAAEHAGKSRLQALIGAASGFVECGGDEILEHLDVFSVRAWSTGNQTGHGRRI